MNKVPFILDAFTNTCEVTTVINLDNVVCWQLLHSCHSFCAGCQLAFKMELLLCYKQEISRLVEEGHTHRDISSLLMARHPNEKGLSERNVRRFCSTYGIHYRCGLADEQLDLEVSRAVEVVGHTYGRKTMQGLLSSKGIHVGQNRVSKALRRVAPSAMNARERLAHRHLNPLPYRASFYGEKLHLDQNEKLGRYGVTHVLAVDGFSRKVVGLITIPQKNAVAIYHALMRPLLLSEGVWDQIRVDHGTEFAIVVSIQQKLASARSHHHRYPVLQRTSTQNHRVERLWVEVNQQVNYPVKRVLISMEENGIIDLSNDIVKFCVSWTTIKVVAPALKLFVESWNGHRIPGTSGGTPNILASSTCNVTSIQECNVPTTDQAISSFTNDGGHLTMESVFGQDPLDGYPLLQQLRARDFQSQYPSVEDIFKNILHSDGATFVQSIEFFIELTD